MKDKKTCEATSQDTNSSLTSLISEMASLKRDKFAHLARVGARKREALAYQEAEEFYFTIVTEQHASLVVLLETLQPLAERNEEMRAIVSHHTSHLYHLTQQLLHFWPKNSDSRERALNLLASEGLRSLLDFTPDGYVSLSTDLILENVAQAIGATQEQLLSQ